MKIYADKDKHIKLQEQQIQDQYCDQYCSRQCTKYLLLFTNYKQYGLFFT